MSRVEVLLNHCVVGLRSKWRTRGLIGSIHEIITKFLVLPVMLSLLLSACAIEGDFGRPQPTVFTKITDEVLLNTNIVTRGLTWPEFTRDEAVLRESGHRLARPLHTNEVPLLLIGRDIDSDHHALTQFGHSAHRVLVSDSQRLDTMLKRDRGLRAKERDGARARLQENYDYIRTVFEDFGRRLQAYHYAIEDVRSHEPDAMVVELRASLDHLRDRSASIKYELNNFYRAALARSDAHPPRPERERLGRRDRYSYKRHPDGGKPYGPTPIGPPTHSFK